MNEFKHSRNARSVLFVGGPLAGQTRWFEYVIDQYVSCTRPAFKAPRLPIGDGLAPDTVVRPTDTYRAQALNDGTDDQDGGTVHWIYVHDSVRYPLLEMMRGYAKAAGNG